MASQLFLELEHRVEEFAAAWRSHDVARIQREFFDADACVVGEGMTRAASDPSSVLAAIEYMVGVAPLISIEIVKASDYSSSIIGSWLNWHVVDAQGAVLATMRSLTVWEKVDGRLVILADSYSTGAL